MEIGIIGGSAAGLYSAILIKKAHPDFHVVLFEKNDRVGKKLAATGNGHCNLLNRSVSGRYFHDSPLATDLFKRYPYETLKQTLEELGVCLTEIGDLVYPACYHAPTYVKFLYDTALDLGVEILLSSQVTDYLKKKVGYNVFVGEKKHYFNRLVFALGAKSQKKLGSDGAFFPILEKHGYHINPLSPSLCPVRVKEKVKSLSGLRHKAVVVAFSDGHPLYIESGEVLFKDDGLSGIAVMNASSYLIREKTSAKKEIVLDLFPSIPVLELKKRFLTAIKANPKFALSTILEKPLLDYLLGYCGLLREKPLDEKDVEKLINSCKTLRFTYISNYDFDSSQVSYGGLSCEEINEHFESKKEKGVYFAGEMIDVDGLCGGFNLSFALASALEVAKSI